jgi:hypothetical protein
LDLFHIVVALVDAMNDIVAHLEKSVAVRILKPRNAPIARPHRPAAAVIKSHIQIRSMKSQADHLLAVGVG